MDLHTLHIEHAVLLGVFTVLTVANCWIQPGLRGVRWFPVYHFYGFVGSLLIVFRGSIPDWISIVFGTAFFSLAYVMLHRTLTEFFGRKAYQWRLQLACTGTALLLLIEWGAVRPNTAARLLSYSLILALQTGLSAAFLFRHASGALRSSGWVVGGVLSLLSLNNLVRAAGTLVMGAPQNYLTGGALNSWVLVNTSVLQAATTIGFVWMSAAELRHDLHLQANTDSLTRLMNRRAIEQAAAREIARSRKSRQPLTAIMIDLDHFKSINDQFGHNFGDAVLQGVARCLQHGTRKQDMLARLGGDEFAVLLPDTPMSTAVEIAERLRLHLERFDLVAAEKRTRISASFGVSELTLETAEWSELLMQCDRALYQVKGAGGNHVVMQ